MVEKSVFICQGINNKIDGTEKQFEKSIVFEPFEFKLP